MTRFNPIWVGIWVVDTLLLVALLLFGVTPAVWLSAAFVLFFIPEMVGIRRSHDSLPPLTQAIRRYIPRWCVLMVIYALGAWAALVWSRRPHRFLILVVIAAAVGWLSNHFDVSFDHPGE